MPIRHMLMEGRAGVSTASFIAFTFTFTVHFKHTLLPSIAGLLTF
jgi:hypothetical protein